MIISNRTLRPLNATHPPKITTSRRTFYPCSAIFFGLSNTRGRSDEFVPTEEKKPFIDVDEVSTDAAQALGAKITGLFKRGQAFSI
uniref:Uncharacterized protein n=1 Tax=Onchocerca volvulus TaxID=6282 RepID=A0A8R1XNS4_ONCVO